MKIRGVSLAALKSHLRIVPGSSSPFRATTPTCLLHCHGLGQLHYQSPLNTSFLPHPLHRITCMPHYVRRLVDSSSEITTKDLTEKKEVVEEAENGRDAPANGNANEENGEQEADDEVEEEGGEEEDGDEDEEAKAATGKRAAEDDEDDDVDTKKQKTDEDDWASKKEKLN